MYISVYIANILPDFDMYSVHFFIPDIPNLPDKSPQTETSSKAHLGILAVIIYSVLVFFMFIVFPIAMEIYRAKKRSSNNESEKKKQICCEFKKCACVDFGWLQNAFRRIQNAFRRRNDDSEGLFENAAALERVDAAGNENAAHEKYVSKDEDSKLEGDVSTKNSNQAASASTNVEQLNKSKNETAVVVPSAKSEPAKKSNKSTKQPLNKSQSYSGASKNKSSATSSPSAIGRRKTLPPVKVGGDKTSKKLSPMKTASTKSKKNKNQNV